MNQGQTPYEYYEARGWKDDDGLLIPPIFRHKPDQWQRQTYDWRSARTAEHVAENLAAELKAIKKAVRPPRSQGKAFTTKAAKAWVRSKGWIIITSERHSVTFVKGKVVSRRADTELASDLVCMDPQNPGPVFVQAGGLSQRKRHREAFEAEGGERVCRGLAGRFVYIEFVRDQAEPVLEEWWVK